MKRLIVGLIAALALAASVSAGAGAVKEAGWTWDENSGSTIIAGPSDGGEI